MKWPYRKIAEFCVTGSGGTPSRQKAGLYYGGDIPWIKSGELKDSILIKTDETITKKGLKESSAKLVPKGSILVAMYGATVGKTALLGINATTNQAICNIQPNPEIVENKFLWHFLKSNIKELLHKRFGGAQPNISQQIIKETKVPIPPISEQRRIVEILNQADRLRKLRADSDTKTKRVLPALFFKMFGDPVSNPRGWEVGKLGDVCERITDGTHQPPPFVENGIPFLFVQNIIKGFINFDTQKFIAQDTYESLTRTIAPQKGDILYSTVGSYGVAVVVDTDRIFLFQRHIGHLRPKTAIIDPWFLSAQMNTPFVRAQADQRARGIAQKTLNLSEIRQFQVLVPPLVEQRKFRNAMLSLEKVNGRMKDQETLIDSLFQVILHRAFIGDLTASWREAHMKELLQEMELQAKVLAS
ncbi:MAG: restriction endonuclease subunit S [Desulfobacteraceae bacterium]|nr:restriction endonuclease subunit S [Desulfobacteraceae bacterium]